MGGLNCVLFQPPSNPSYSEDNRHLFWIYTAECRKIPAVYFRFPSAANTILFSHGNAEDIGNVSAWCFSLSQQLGVNVMAYEYSGYGCSSDGVAPSEESCYCDIQAAMDYLDSVHGVKPKRVVLFGRSLGTAVSVRLAEVQEARGEPVRGIVLQSPFTSAVRVACGECKATAAFDQFVTIDRIHKLRSKVLIVHGMLDAIVPASHGHELLMALDPRARPSTAPLFIAAAGHNNVEAVCQRDGSLIRRLSAFLAELSALHGGILSTYNSSSRSSSPPRLPLKSRAPPSTPTDRVAVP